jgi:hypothetical protein
LGVGSWRWELGVRSWEGIEDPIRFEDEGVGSQRDQHPLQVIRRMFRHGMIFWILEGVNFVLDVRYGGRTAVHFCSSAAAVFL